MRVASGNVRKGLLHLRCRNYCRKRENNINGQSRPSATVVGTSTIDALSSEMYSVWYPRRLRLKRTPNVSSNYWPGLDPVLCPYAHSYPHLSLSLTSSFLSLLPSCHSLSLPSPVPLSLSTMKVFRIYVFVLTFGLVVHFVACGYWLVCT